LASGRPNDYGTPDRGERALHVAIRKFCSTVRIDEAAHQRGGNAEERFQAVENHAVFFRVDERDSNPATFESQSDVITTETTPRV